MTEKTISPTVAYRTEVFSQLEAATRICGDEEFQKIYALSRFHWGIESPACIIYKNFFPSHPYRECLPAELKGDIFIAINKDVVPEAKFIEYLKLHEYWEHYIRSKSGFNLLEADEKDYSKPIFERERPAHKLAILKEFEAAEADGNLDRYMDWWREFYERDTERVLSLPDIVIAGISVNYNGEGREGIVSFIHQNLVLRETIFNRLKLKARIKNTQSAGSFGGEDY